jgi:FdhD protein
METNTEKFPVLQYTDDGKNRIEKTVAREFLLTIFLNGQELVTIMCSPKDLKYLAVGFLVSEGLLNGPDEIKTIEVDEFAGIVRVKTKASPEPDARFFAKRLITSGCGGGATFYAAADIAAGENRIKNKNIGGRCAGTGQRISAPLRNLFIYSWGSQRRYLRW